MLETRYLEMQDGNLCGLVIHSFELYSHSYIILKTLDVEEIGDKVGIL